jgi:hypothetical protein
MGENFSVVTLAPALDFSSEYVGPGQKYGDYSAFGQITGLCPFQLQAPNATRLAGQRAV